MAGSRKPGTSPQPDGSQASFSRLLREGLGSLAASLAFFAVMYLTNIVFARILSPADYGDYAIGMTALTLGGMVALAGAGHSMTRYLPDYLVHEDWARIAGFIRYFVPFAILAGLVLGGSIWVANLFTGDWLGLGEGKDGLHPVAVAAMVIPLYALSVLGNRLLRSYGFVKASFFPNRLLAPALTLGLVAGLKVMGMAIADWMVMAAVGVGYVLAVIVEVSVFVAYGYHRVLKTRPAYEVRTWLGSALPMMMVGLLAMLLHHADLIMLELIATDEAAVGQYAAINNTILILTLILGSLSLIVGPMLGRALGRAAPERAQWLLGNATMLLLIGCGVPMVAIIIFRDQVLGLFGPSYTAAAGALVIACLAYGLTAIFGLSRLFLQYLGHHRYALLPAAGAVVVNLILDALLIPQFGVTGAALATFAALVSMRAIHLALLYRATGLVALPFRLTLTARAKRLQPLGVFEGHGAGKKPGGAGAGGVRGNRHP